MQQNVMTSNKFNQTKKNLKICLIHPYATIPPYGILSIAKVLEKDGFDVKILTYDKLGVQEDEVLPEIEGMDLIGMSTYSMPMISEAVNITKIIKKHSNAFLVWGGVHPTLFPKKPIEEFDIDATIANEGEYTMLALAQALRDGRDLTEVKGLYLKKDGEIISTGIREPILESELQSGDGGYAWHLYDMTRFVRRNFATGKKYVTLIESRGCPFDCKFCYVNTMFGRKWRGRSIPQMIDDIEYLKKTYGVNHIDFLDDLPFGGNKEKFMELCYALKAAEVTWTCDTRINVVDYELLKTMRDCGCTFIYFGVESGSPKILKMINKAGITPEKVIKVLDMCYELGIVTMAGFITGFPDETPEDLELTWKLIKRVKATKVRLFRYTPYPGGELYEVSKQKGFKEPEKTEDWANLGNYYKNKINLSEISDELITATIKKVKLTNLWKNVKFSVDKTDVPYFLDFISDQIVHNFIDKLPQVIYQPLKKLRRI